jgi:hypothetical protein
MCVREREMDGGEYMCEREGDGWRRICVRERKMDGVW